MNRQTNHKQSFKRFSYTSRYKLKKNYYIFLFVRYPFERLVSAYRNKLVQPFAGDLCFQEEVGIKVIQKYGKDSTITNDTCTFAEFVQFLCNQAVFSTCPKSQHKA